MAYLVIARGLEEGVVVRDPLQVVDDGDGVAVVEVAQAAAP